MINPGDHPCETGLLKNKRPRWQLLKGVWFEQVFARN